MLLPRGVTLADLGIDAAHTATIAAVPRASVWMEFPGEVVLMLLSDTDCIELATTSLIIKTLLYFHNGGGRDQFAFILE